MLGRRYCSVVSHGNNPVFLLICLLLSFSKREARPGGGFENSAAQCPEALPHCELEMPIIAAFKRSRSYLQASGLTAWSFIRVGNRTAV